jgi:hypothetical protein
MANCHPLIRGYGDISDIKKKNKVETRVFYVPVYSLSIRIFRNVLGDILDEKKQGRN